MIDPGTTTFSVSLSDFGVDSSSLLTENEEIKRLRRKNPVWEEYWPRWCFYSQAYEGGEDFANRNNLFRHSRENEKDFDKRVERVHNMNYCEPLVDFFTNFIFSESIDRGGGTNKTWYDDFVKDVNRKGESVDDFMRQVSDDMQIYGMSYVLVDMPPLPESDNPNAVLTKQDEKDIGLTPYWVLVKPEEIIDWSVNEFESFTYVRRLQIKESIDSKGNPNKTEHYTEFFPDRIDVTDIDITLMGQATLGQKVSYPNKMGGKIPFYVTRYKRSKKYAFMGKSFLNDFAYNQREIMNLTSLLQEFLYRQAFNILTREVDSVIPLQEQGDVVLGTANVLDYPKGAHPPAYISPPSQPAAFIQSERALIKNEMYTRASQDAMVELFNGEGASGFSQAQSFYKTVPFISSRADQLERTENGLMECTLDLLGKTWDGKIKYKDRYELTNLTDALTQLMVLVRDLGIPSETFVKEELKRMALQYDGKLPVDVLTKIMNDIDKMDYKEWTVNQQLALTGGAGTSPGAQQKKDTTTLREVTKESGQTTQRATSDLKV